MTVSPVGSLVPGRDNTALGACAVVNGAPARPHVLVVLSDQTQTRSMSLRIEPADFRRFCEIGAQIAFVVEQEILNLEGALPSDLPGTGKDFEP